MIEVRKYRHTRFWAVYVDGGFGNVDGVKAVGRDGKWTGGWGKGSSMSQEFDFLSAPSVIL